MGYQESRDTIVLTGDKLLVSKLDPFPMSKTLDTSAAERKREFHYRIEGMGDGPYPPECHIDGDKDKPLLFQVGDRVLVSGGFIPVVLDCVEYHIITANCVVGVIHVGKVFYTTDTGCRVAMKQVKVNPNRNAPTGKKMQLLETK